MLKDHPKHDGLLRFHQCVKKPQLMAGNQILVACFCVTVFQSISNYN